MKHSAHVWSEVYLKLDDFFFPSNLELKEMKEMVITVLFVRNLFIAKALAFCKLVCSSKGLLVNWYVV